MTNLLTFTSHNHIYFIGIELLVWQVAKLEDDDNDDCNITGADVMFAQNNTT